MMVDTPALLPFAKMHGLGNDFVVVDARERPVAITEDLVRAIADRKTGVGCDQLIVIGSSLRADVSMRIFNQDGGEVDACGNATRCVPLFVGRDVTIEPNVFIGPGVIIEDRVTIRANSHIVGRQGKDQAGLRIREGAIVGPFARLRPGADIGREAHIGNFVEVKNAVMEAGAKANHLAYIGDGRVGAEANIGAGTIFCNYDGFQKHHTDVGAGAFIGSNSALVAPIKIGAGAYVGSGSVVTKNVPADALAVARAPQEVREGWAAKYRERRKRKS